MLSDTDAEKGSARIASAGSAGSAHAGFGRGRLARGLVWLSLLGLPALYFASFFNRFAGLRSGAGEYASGVLFLSGVLPYRDYFTAGPPLNTLKSALLLKVFGETLVVSRLAGVAERLVIGVLLFVWLRRLFRVTPALVASVAAVILSAADCTDPIASYNHDALLWAIASGWLTSRLFDERISTRRAGLNAVGAGVCAGLSILTKQTIGLASAMTVLVCVALLTRRLRGARRAMRMAMLFAVGCALPVAALLLLLARMHLLGEMLRMLFVAGPRAKASHPVAFVTRELVVAWGNAGWVVLGAVVLLVSWRPMLRGLSGDSAEPESEAARGPAWVLGVGLLTIGGAEVLGLTGLPALDDVTKSAVYFSFLGSTMLLAVLAVRGLRGSAVLTSRGAEVLLFAALSWATAASLSLSWPAFEAMLLPGVALLLAALVEGARGRARRWAYVGVAMAVFLSMREKLDRPFLFDGQQEQPVREAKQRSTLPALRGMRLSASTVDLLDGVTATIRQSTRAGDTVFTYPEMGLLYALSGRLPPTFAESHNIDVVNDQFAREEAMRLLAAPPRVIVYYRQSEAELRATESLWRDDRPSGQRDLIAAVERLTAGYRLAGQYRLAIGDTPIEVYVRR